MSERNIKTSRDSHDPIRHGEGGARGDVRQSKQSRKRERNWMVNLGFENCLNNFKKSYNFFEQYSNQKAGARKI